MKYLRGLGYFLSTILLYLGVPLAGWWFADLQGFFSVAYRTGYAGVVIIFSLAVGIQAIDAPEGIQGSSGIGRKVVRRQTIIGYLLTFVLFSALIFLPFAARRDIGVYDNIPALCWVGLSLCALGYLLVFWSGLSLGKQFSAEVTIHKNHQLITSGLYRSIRHPRYLGILSLALGISLLFHSWIGLLLCIVVIILIQFRIFDEEKLLQREFSTQWETYCHHSWRLIPYIY
jgi:protein-S-isoprenylcysteine O-methyltransferase Ste14